MNIGIESAPDLQRRILPPDHSEILSLSNKIESLPQNSNPPLPDAFYRVRACFYFRDPVFFVSSAFGQPAIIQ
jgi:hypothetical protein